MAYWPFDTDFSNAEGTADFDGIPAGTAEISAEDVKVGAGALKIADDTLSANHVVAMGDFVGPAPVVRTVVGWYKYADINGDGSDARNFIWETQPNWSLSFAIRDGAEGKYSQWYNQTETEGSLHGEGPIVDDGLWHHAAVVWNSVLDHVKYYHDGQLLEIVDVNTRNWDGYIDEIAIFSVELSERQVLGLYEQSETINPLNVLNQITAPEEDPGKATLPVPEDGALLNALFIMLEWQPGLFAVSHDVYVGVDFNEVSTATLDDVGIFMGNTLDSFFFVGIGSAIPGGLVPGTTYYWRVDEVNEADPLSPWKGDVWSFSIQ
ncbi:MAG: hypothetical protein ACYTGS_20540 [Planctomycetota bacterium]